jgi:hypothetical protein
MEIKQRGLVLDVNDKVRLDISIIIGQTDSGYIYSNADILPSISIIQPGGMVYLPRTNTGVMSVETGKYYYDFTVPFTGPYGVWNDLWTVTCQGFTQVQTLSYVVTGTQVPQNPSSDGFAHLGDDFPYNYSQNEVFNINKMLKMLKARLNSDGKSLAKDAYGNEVYVSCSTFSVNTLVTFLGMALSDFNQVPYFTSFTFADSGFVAQFADILVNGATIYSLASKALIEKGAEFTITDNGVNFQPAAVSDMLKAQADTLLANYTEKLKYIKNSMRPYPLGLGSFNIMSSDRSPIIKALSHRRENRII